LDIHERELDWLHKSLDRRYDELSFDPDIGILSHVRLDYHLLLQRGDAVLVLRLRQMFLSQPRFNREQLGAK
jgi:hypothetical protein